LRKLTAEGCDWLRKLSATVDDVDIVDIVANNLNIIIIILYIFIVARPRKSLEHIFARLFPPGATAIETGALLKVEDDATVKLGDCIVAAVTAARLAW